MVAMDARGVNDIIKGRHLIGGKSRWYVNKHASSPAVLTFLNRRFETPPIEEVKYFI